MPRRDDDLLDIPSIVPDTDGRPASQVAQEATVSNVPSEHRTTVKVALPLLFLALAGACAFFHYELTKLRSENQQWSARVANLESQLGVAHSENEATRQSLDQKVASLETNMKARQDDIKQLQQALKTAQENSSKELAALKTQTAQLQQQDAQLKKDADTSAQQQNSKIAQLEAAQASVSKAISEQLSPLAQQVQQLQTNAEQSRTQLSQATAQASEAALSSAQAVEANEQLQVKINELSKELRSQRESITSLDSFRRSANNDLNRLKQGAGAY